MNQIELTDFQYKVLSHIYTFTERGNKPVVASKLANVVGIRVELFIEAILELEKKLLVNFNAQNHGTWLTPRGVSELEYPASNSNNSVTHNTTNINAPNMGNIMTGSSYNSQNYVAKNPDFNNAIQELIELINKSDLHYLDKEERLAEIRRIEDLSQREQNSEVQKHALSKIKLLDTGLKVGELAVKAAPLIEILTKTFGG